MAARVQVGDIFSRLTVESLSHTSKRADGSTGVRVFNCRCVCGKLVKVRSCNLRSGNTKSCGCYHSEKSIQSNKARHNV